MINTLVFMSFKILLKARKKDILNVFPLLVFENLLSYVDLNVQIIFNLGHQVCTEIYT